MNSFLLFFNYRLSHQSDHTQIRGADPILPAILDFVEDTEEVFFHAIITDVDPIGPLSPSFKLAPTFTLYLAARYRASTHYKPELTPTARAHRLTVMLMNVSTMIYQVICERSMDGPSLSLWLANASELLHFLQSDRHIGPFSVDAQNKLRNSVVMAFTSLIHCVSIELGTPLRHFMSDVDEAGKEEPLIQIFTNIMGLLRVCRVNPSYTIQLFNHLFHSINAICFNSLVANNKLCARWFGRRLKSRICVLEAWIEDQGLEHAGQCHLATIKEAAHLLQAAKYNPRDLSVLQSNCSKLNSLQVRALLQKYQSANDEPRLTSDLIENVVRMAEKSTDAALRAQRIEIRLEEEPSLPLDLLFPDDGYNSELIRGIPPGLAEFLAPLQKEGLCRFAGQANSRGFWTIYMVDLHHHNIRSPSAMSNRSAGYSANQVTRYSSQPVIQTIKLHKSTNGMGLSIVAARVSLSSQNFLYFYNSFTL